MFKTIDLCAGIGGMRSGFELTGSFKGFNLQNKLLRFAVERRYV